jgi:outer membrane protein
MSSRVREFGAVAALMLAGCLGAAPAAFAANARVGFIDSGKIFQDYTRAKEAQAQFDRQVQNWRNEAAEKEKAVNALRAEVRDQAPILSSLRRQEKEEALQKAIQDYENFIQEIWGPQGRAAQENERSTREIVDRIRSVVEKMATDKGLDLVFDAASGMIIYADRSLDLSADVVRELNALAETNKQ